MITPRRTRLVRVPDLHAFRATCAAVAIAGDTALVRDRVVVVPTRGAGRQLRRTIEARRPGASLLPELVTRDQMLEQFHARLTDPPARLTTYERHAMLRSAARDAARDTDAPFRIRPGLVAEMLRFYDQLRNQARELARFEELAEEALQRGAEYDRGAERMLRQTRVLAAAFHGYERRVADSGACDEHALRSRVVAERAADPLRHVVVTVGDWIADPSGLFVADFDLLARVPGLEAIDIVATGSLLASGFHQRIREWLPGLEEIDARDLGVDSPSPRPVLAVPADGEDRLFFRRRDREEELIAVARRVRVESAEDPGAMPASRVAVVFKRPLPYLYLGRSVFGSAGVPFEASDALPLAGEPFAAALDLVLEAAGSNFTRDALVALLRSPHFVFADGDEPVSRRSIAELDRMLSDARYLGDLERLEGLEGREGRDAPALRAAVATARELLPLTSPAPASHQLERVIAFLIAHAAPPEAAPPGIDRDRLRRARATVLDVLRAMAAAHATHDDEPCAIDDLSTSIRRWIEDETFVVERVAGSEPLRPLSGRAVQLVDEQAARYGDFDDLTICGVVEGEWPERPRRNIFYPPSLLQSLGWPSEADRRAASEARFLELVASASARVTVSTFELEDDGMVEPSPLLDALGRTEVLRYERSDDRGDGRTEVLHYERGDDRGDGRTEVLHYDRGDDRGDEHGDEHGDERGDERSDDGSDDLRDERAGVTQSSPRIMLDEALSIEPVLLDGLDDSARGWADLRLARTPSSDAAFHGQSAGVDRAWSVSALEQYLVCPFRFFAQHVLRLDEEPDDEETMDPRREGQIVHAVFEAFFHAWQAEGGRAITPETLDAARTKFAEVVDACLASLPGTEASLLRNRLLGSPAAAGLGDAVLRMEAERAEPVVDRLLEHRLEGRFVFETAGGTRELSLKGKADRIDLLGDGTFRLIDYKLGTAPAPSRALQLSIYGLCAEQQLSAARVHGRRWTLGEAAYVAFGGPRRVARLFTTDADRVKVLGQAQETLVSTVDRIARGDFPPTPQDVFHCTRCSFTAVCRLDYVGDV